VSNVIDFLERVGQEAELRQATSEALEEALVTAGIEPALRAAILGKNQSALEALLGTATNVCCLVNKPDEEEEEEPGEEEEESEEEEEKDVLEAKCEDHDHGNLAA
jgi:hypothetical protein